MNETDSELANRFPSETAGLSEAGRTRTIELADGDEVEIEIGPVRKRIGGADVRMLAYDRSIPGPTLVLRQGATATVHVTNRGDLPTTVHWHGLRLENRYDGTHDTQAPIPVGGTFRYDVHAPDAGAYWYHPHIREDYGQELGLYGNILVIPAEPDYWPPVDREILLTLDDILVEGGRVAPFHRSEATHVAMGRFGNVMLVSGEPELSLTATRGEVVRLYLTNTANTRVFNVASGGARIKLVGADAGHYEHERMVDEVLVAPSERVVVDLLFDGAGEVTLEHRTPARAYRLATVAVADERVSGNVAERFGELRTNPDMVAVREQVAPYVESPPDKTLAFVAELALEAEGAGAYACPMHPEVVSDEPGRCPMCGMKLVPESLVGHGEAHGHGAHDQWDHHDEHSHAGEGHAHAAAQGIEWEDDMVEVNRLTTVANVRWKLVDLDTGADNADIDWRFRVGDRVKIRLVNELDSDHPMPHPFHVHGAGRFLILSRDGVVEPNLVWKDTVLVRTGETVDILLEVTNPGRWMAHCHIAEHHEAGMMLSFDVDPADA